MKSTKKLKTQIENNHKNNGWISLTTIAAIILNKFPDSNKKIKLEYGFKNLHDLVLNSGLFLLKSEPTLKGERILIKLNNQDVEFYSYREIIISRKLNISSLYST